MKKVNWRPGTRVKTPDGLIAPVSKYILNDTVKVYTWEFGTWYSIGDLVRADNGERLIGKPKNLEKR